MKRKRNPSSVRRGAKFVLGLGTKVIPDKKKEKNRNNCRKNENDSD
jgi:hypothetical protein